MSRDSLKEARGGFELLRQLGERPEDLQRAVKLHEAIERLERETADAIRVAEAKGMELNGARDELRSLLGLPTQAVREVKVKPSLEALIRSVGLPSAPDQVRLTPQERRALALVPHDGAVALDDLARAIYPPEDDRPFLKKRGSARKIVEGLVARGIVEHKPGESIYRRTALGRAVEET